MKSWLGHIEESVRKYFWNSDTNVSKWDAETREDFYSYNLNLCMMAAAMVCGISLIGLVGTYSPYSTGFIIPVINPTVIYLVIFVANLLSFDALQYARSHRQRMTLRRLWVLFSCVTGIDMILASATFFTTQKNSSFFFEYILITLIIYLLPNAGTFSFFCNMFINVVSVFVVLTVAAHPIAWQDVVDIAALQVICAFVNRSRRKSFLQQEKVKSSIEKQKDQFYHDSRVDELTHIANRTALRADFPKFLNRSLCIAMIDLNFFKKYNDTYGHAYGDRVLEMTGTYMRRIFRDAGDHCYRYGGDEFLVISENESIAVFRERLTGFQKLCSTSEDSMGISCSIGYFAGLPHTEKDLRNMIRNADYYLYQAKREDSAHMAGGVMEMVSERSRAVMAELPAADSSVKAGYDALTGLPDMHLFLDIMRKYRLQKRDVSEKGELAVLYFDLINFRMINLMYGMSYGDDTLWRMEESLLESFSDSIVSHWDVDRFTVLTDTRHLEKRAKDALERINRVLPYITECSAGACVWEDHSLDAETVCSRAKAASDDNRKKVGIHFSYYTDAIGATLKAGAYVVSHIDEAVKKGWIVVYYQPIVRALSNRVCGMEALARWQDPERGLFPPADFVKPLEDARQIYKLDLCVIQQVVKQIADRYREKLPEIPISVNLSRLDFLCCDIYQEIENLVKAYDIPRRMLHIEVTESIMMSEEDATLKALQSFRDAGYEIWMDDFGSGYSALNLLKDYSFDLLKLDMAFLRRDSQRSRDIISSVIEMDKKLGIRTLAEGVETREQAEYLKKSGCEKLQGYYFGRPMPFDEVMRNCLDKGIGVESAAQKICYDALGRVSFMTDIPLLIWEVQGKRAELLFANDPGMHLVHLDGFRDLKALEADLNDGHNLVNREMMEAVKDPDAVNGGGEIMVYFNGNKQLLRYQMLGAYEDTHLYVTYVYSQFPEEENHVLQNQLLMNLAYFYRYLFTIDARHMTIQRLRFSNPAVPAGRAEPVRDRGRYASILPAIFEADQRRYDVFMDPSTLTERLAAAKYGIIRDVFRTKGADGTYLWMSHRMLLVPHTGSGQILYVIRTIDLPDELASQPGLHIEETGEDLASKAQLFNTMIHHVPLPMFWKDNERRFLGASQSFLDYYGFASVYDIIGRTDEDMGWHPNNEKYEEDEKEILFTGETHQNVPGKCISNAACG